MEATQGGLLTPPLLKIHKRGFSSHKYLPSMSFPIRFVSPTGKKIAIIDKLPEGQRAAYQPEGKAVLPTGGLSL